MTDFYFPCHPERSEGSPVLKLLGSKKDKKGGYFSHDF
jgi:hypothetical protein